MSTSPTKILNSIANLWFEHYLWAFSCLKYDQKHILFGLFYDVEVKWEQATTFFKSKTQRRPQVLQSGCCRCSSIGANFCMTNMRGFYHFPTPLLPQTQIWNFPLCHCSVLLCGLGIKTSDSLVCQTSINSHNWMDVPAHKTVDLWTEATFTVSPAAGQTCRVIGSLDHMFCFTSTLY